MAFKDTPEAFFFDLDGTLVDSVPDLSQALNIMLQQLNLPMCPEQEVRNWVGRGPWKLVEDAIAPHDVDQHTAELAAGYFRIAYRELSASSDLTSKLYSGVQETLEGLHEQTVPMALITNKDIEFAGPLLNSLGIADYFSVTLGGACCAERKPFATQLHAAADHMAVDVTQVIMVGDSNNDLQAAKAAGCQSVLVDYGYNGGQDVHAMGATKVVSSLMELLTP